MPDMNWQTMETAPKDGREIVLWCEDAQLLVHAATWERNRWYEIYIDEVEGETWRTIDPSATPSHWLELIPPCPM
jgi:hypothetical protein